LLMILLAESSTPPRDETETPGTNTANTAQKDFRNILKNIKIVPENPSDKKTKHRILLAKRLPGIAEPANGPMAILLQMEEVRTNYLDELDLSVIEVPAGWDANWLLEIIQQDPSVKYAEVDISAERIPHAESAGIIPNDPVFKRQYNLHDPDRGVDIDAPEAWAYTTGSDHVIVVVRDSIIDLNSTDLRPNLWVNEAELEGDEGVDDDDNGCIDDIHGCEFSYMEPGNGNIQYDSRFTHGTEVSSVLGARGNNNYGITGVAWNVRIMSVSGFTMSMFNYLLKMRRKGVNIRVMNDSGGSASEDCPRRGRQAEYDGISALGAEGVLYVNSGGNSGRHFMALAEAHTPACYDLHNIIVVGGQEFHRRGIRSSYGKAVVDLMAPGEFIQTISAGGAIIRYTGTSYAAPQVAGAAALLWSYKPDMTVTDVRNTLLNTVDRFPAFEDAAASGGALNIANALYSVATPGIRIHSSQTTITEGNSGYIDLSLTREPVRPSVGEVVVLEGVATPLSDADAVVTPSTLTFTSRNWHIPQRMTVRAAGTSGSEITLQVEVDQHLSTTHYQSVPMRTATMTLQSEGIRPTLHIPARIAEGDTATATIHFSDRLLNAVQFTITATGTATANTDYMLPDTITAEADSTSATFTIQTINNPGYNGPDKTIHLQINTDNPRISPQALQATLTIEDSDTPIMTITVLPRTISQSNTQATAPTATATITLDRMAVQDVTFSLNARPIGGGDINHLFNNISRNVWPVTATIVEDATATEIIIHSIDEDDVEGITHWIRLYPALPPDAAARLGQPNRALLITRDDDGDSSTYLRLRVFLEGAVLTNTTTIQTNP